MGLSLTNTHIHNLANLTKPQFKKVLTDMMKSKGYVKATEDDAAVSFSLIFTKDRKWVTVLGEDINTSDLAKSLGLQVLSVELVDSDFAELKLHTTDGAADILMLGRPYMDEYPDPTPDKWQSILSESTWSQVEEIQSGDHTFTEDALAEFAQLIGLGENILLENDDIPDGAEILHFKKAKEKKLTLNAAFKQVFGPELEKRGFKLAKGGNMYIGQIAEDVFAFITFEKEDSRYLVVPEDLLQKAIDLGKVKDISHFNIRCAIKTLYHPEMPFKIDRINTNSFYSNYWISNRYSLLEDNTTEAFAYLSGDDESLLSAMELCLAISKELLFSVVFGIDSFDSYFEYAYKTNSFFPKELYFKCNDYEKVLNGEFELSVECEKTKLQYLKKDVDQKEWFDQRKQYLMESYEAKKKEIESIMNDENKHTEIMKKIADRKQRNIDILRKYGIEI